MYVALEAEIIFKRLFYVALLDSNDPSVTFQDKGPVSGVSGLQSFGFFKVP